MSVDFTPFTQSPGFTFFHTRLWIDTLLKAFPRWRDDSRLIDLPDGRKALLPLLETDRVGPWRWLEAMPYGFYGGPLASQGGLTRDDLALMLREVGHGAGWLAFNLDPFDPLACTAMLPLGATPLTTHILALSGDFEAIQKGFTKTMRYDMRRAERDGVTTRCGHGEADFHGYFMLTQEAASRWGLTEPPYPLALFQALAQLPVEVIRLWLAEYDGKAIGGLINIYYAPGSVMHWASALDPDYTHLNPTKLLQREAIREACEKGVTVYNMGPSVGFDGAPLEGVRQAKEALGARPHNYAIPIMMNPWAMRARVVQNRLRDVFSQR